MCFQSLDNLAKTYNTKQVGIVFLNVNTTVLQTLEHLLDEHSLKLFQTIGVVDSASFPVRDVEAPEEETPLVNGNDVNNRRFSEDRIDIRKGSLCDLE